MTNTTKLTPSPKTTESKTPPGMRRLKASPAAETIRASVLADQANGRAEVIAQNRGRHRRAQRPAKAPLAAPAPCKLVRTRNARQRPAPSPPASAGKCSPRRKRARCPPRPISPLTSGFARSWMRWSRSSRRAMSRASPSTGTTVSMALMNTSDPVLLCRSNAVFWVICQFDKPNGSARSLGLSHIPSLRDGVMLSAAWIDRPVDTQGRAPCFHVLLSAAWEAQPCVKPKIDIPSRVFAMPPRVGFAQATRNG